MLRGLPRKVASVQDWRVTHRVPDRSDLLELIAQRFAESLKEWAERREIPRSRGKDPLHGVRRPFADAAGVDETKISRLLSRERLPELEFFIAAAAELDVRLGWLLVEELPRRGEVLVVIQSRGEEVPAGQTLATGEVVAKLPSAVPPDTVPDKRQSPDKKRRAE